MANNNNWFERVPGNYYKSQTQPGQPPQQDNRRYSDEYDNRDNRRDSHRSRSSFDRDNSRYADEKRDSNERYGYNDGYDRRNESYDDVRYRRDYRDPDVRRYDDVPPRDQPSPHTAAAAGFATGVSAAHMKDGPQASSPRSAGEASYVPYSHIYGDNSQASPQTYAPSPIGSPQPHRMNQVSPGQSRDYSEDRHRGYDGHDDRYDDSRDSRVSRRPQRPPMRSRSHESFDSRDDPRYPMHPARAYGRSRKDSPKSVAGVTFDKSQRGLGYGAVGAIAGALVGSSVGKGKAPTAIGAALGGLGANMFEARERRKDSARSSGFLQDDDMNARREQREKGKREKSGDWKD